MPITFENDSNPLTRTIFVIFLSLSAFFISSTSSAGPGLSGGGQGVVCRNPDGTVRSAQLLDLAEGEKYYLLSIEKNQGASSYLEIAHRFASILDQAIPASDPTSEWTNSEGGRLVKRGFDINPSVLMAHRGDYKYISESVDRIDKSKMMLVGDDFKIPPVLDSHPHIIPSGTGCGIEQIAVYSDGDQKIRIVGSVWDKLNSVNKAALLIHEALYRDLRSNGETSSDRARKAVAYLFSGLNFQWILEDLPQQFLMCWTTDRDANFRFAVLPGANDQVDIWFLRYAGETMLTLTKAVFPLGPFRQFFGLTPVPIGNSAVFRDLKNPMLELPGYNFETSMDDSSGKSTMSLEAIQGSAGTHLSPIECGSGLTTISYGADGSVGSSTRH